MKRISIIIPAYNSAPFIGETLENIISEEFEGLEILVINDGSSDNTSEVVRSYAEKCADIRLIEKENGGVSSARNLGIKEAEGKYICFQDADDLYAPGTLSALWERAEKTKADVLIFRLRNFTSEAIGKFNPHCDIISMKDEIDPFDLELLWCFLVSNKFYRRDRLVESGVRFPASRYSEEGAFFISYILTKPKISGCHDAVALYRRHSREEGLSVSQTVSLPLAKSFCDSMDIIYEKALDGTKDLDEKKREEYLGEILYKKAYVLTAQFYRPMWLGDDECVPFCAETISSLLEAMPKNRKEVMLSADSDLRLSSLPSSKTEVAENPNVSVILLPAKKNASDFISGMYAQLSPMFELFVPKSIKDRGEIPSLALSCANLRILPDKGFKSAAKKKAKGKIIIFHRPVKLDVRLISLTYKLKRKLPATLVDAFFPFFAKALNFALVKRILK